MTRIFVTLALLALWTAEARAATIGWVPVGNAGNAPDPNTGSLYGAVAYNYNIDKYDVTVGQYAEFLNAVAKTDTYGLYNAKMATDLNIAGISQSGFSGSYTYSVIGSSANLPITYVNYGNAERFANWLQNGQPTGAEGPCTTETGTYTLTFETSGTFTRNPGATVFIPNENEWYKAAYYNPATSSYYKYPYSNNTVPTSAMPGSKPNTGNFTSNSGAYAVTHSPAYSASQNYLTAVGAYTESASPYGAFDMGGDVLQWNEALLGGSSAGVTGAWWSDIPDNLLSIFQEGNGYELGAEFDNIGFRVAETPEPSSLVLAALGFIGLAAYGVVRARNGGIVRAKGLGTPRGFHAGRRH